MRLLAASVLFLASLRSAWAGPVGWAPAVSFDYIGTGNLSRHRRNDGNSQCRALVSQGAAACSAGTSAGGAIGGRVGLMYRTEEFSVGPSIGAYFGGPTAGSTSFTVIPAGAGKLSTRNTTYRFLIEDAKRFPINDEQTILLGAGLGIALAHEIRSCTATGSLAGLCPPNRALNLGFFTWEVGPSILFGPVELAVRYVGFARHALFPWQTFSASAGLRF